MDTFLIYKTLNKNILNIAESVQVRNVLQAKNEDAVHLPVRLKESPLIISEDSKRTVDSIITAHDITQYKKSFYSIKLEEKTDSVLQSLLRIDYEVKRNK